MPSRFVALLLILATSIAIGVATASAGAPGDLASARKVAIQVGDLPSGWSARVGPSSDTGCFSGPARTGSTAFVRDQRFLDDGGQNEVTGQVSVFSTVAAARRALARVSGPAPLACYRKKLPPQLTVGGVSVTGFSCGDLELDPIGDHAAASRCIVTLKKGSSTGQLFIDSIFVQRGRFLIGDGFLSEVGRPAVAGELTLVAKAVARTPKTKTA